MTKEQRKAYRQIADDITIRAAEIHFHGGTDIPLNQPEFIAMFYLGSLQAQKGKDGSYDFTFAGLTVNKVGFN